MNPETDTFAGTFFNTEMNEIGEGIKMAFCIMNVQKQCRFAVGGLQIEANRQPDDGREFDRSDIDKTRTELNYFLRHCENWNKEITRQIREAGVKERKDSIVAITGVFTASPEWFQSHSKEEWRQYFEDCLAFFDKTYCHAINAVVHLDETTPHMQVVGVPIVEDEKGKHLSAKILMGTPATFRRRQTEFYNEVGKKYGLERGEERDPAEVKKHTTKREWQIKDQAERIEAQDKTIKAQTDKLEQTLSKITEAANELAETQGRVLTAREANKRQLDEQNIILRAFNKVFKTDYVLVEQKNYNDIQKTAAKVQSDKKQRAAVEKLRNEAEAQADRLEGLIIEKQPIFEAVERDIDDIERDIFDIDEIIEQADFVAKNSGLNPETVEPYKGDFLRENSRQFLEYVRRRKNEERKDKQMKAFRLRQNLNDAKRTVERIRRDDDFDR